MKVFSWQYRNEKVLYISNEHPVSFLKHNFSIILSIFWVSFFVGFLIVFFLNNYFIWFVSGVILLILGLLYCVISRRKTKYIITTKRVILQAKSWPFISFKKEMELREIKENVSTKKWLLNNLFDIWNIKIVWWWVIWFRWVKYPEEVSSYLSRLRDFLKENPNFDYQQIKEFIPRKIRKNLES